LKRIFILFFLLFSCGSKVSENIPVPGITTGPLDLTVKDVCGNPLKDLDIYVSGISEPVKTDENGEVHIKNVFKPYFITFKRENEPYLTYRSKKSSLEVFDINSSCETFTSIVTGQINIPYSVTGPVRIFAYPGGWTETSVYDGKGDYSMELKLPKIPISVNLVGVFYEKGEPKYFGKSTIQITSEGQIATSDLKLTYEPVITIGGKITPPSGINKKIEISYYFLFNNTWNPEPITNFVYIDKPPTYNLTLPNPAMLSMNDGFIVIGRTLMIDERGTPSDESDDEITGSVSVNLIEKSSAKDGFSLDLSFIDHPALSNPADDSKFDKIPDIEWVSSLSGFTLIEFHNLKGELLWRIVVDSGDKKISPSEVPAIDMIKSDFPSMRYYFVSVYTYPVDLSQISKIFYEGEWVLHGNGYSFVKGRRFYLK
jgi:hypothetical protein